MVFNIKFKNENWKVISKIVDGRTKFKIINEKTNEEKEFYITNVIIKEEDYHIIDTIEDYVSFEFAKMLVKTDDDFYVMPMIVDATVIYDDLIEGRKKAGKVGNLNNFENFFKKLDITNT